MHQFIAWILYVLAFLASALFIASLYVFFVDKIVLIITGKGVNDSKQNIFVSIPVYLIWILLIIVGPLYFLRILGMDPPLGRNEISVENIDDKNQVIGLNEEIEKINSTLSNIDNLTLNQIQTEFVRIRDFVNKLKEEIELQNEMNIDLKLQAKKLKTDVEKTSKIANEIKSLNEDQLNAIKFLITEDANKKNIRSFWIGAVISFPIGVLASLFGNFLLELRRKKEKTLV